MKSKHSVFLAIFILIIVLLEFVLIKKDEVQIIWKADAEYQDIVEWEEDPFEAIKIENAVIETIGTDREVEAWGFSITNVAKAIYAEAGANSEELQRAICTCIYNTQKKHDWQWTPEDVIREYNYATSSKYSDEVMEVCIDVFLRGNLCEKVEDATLFYNPKVLGRTNDYHENQIHVCTIENVKFFKEV